MLPVRLIIFLMTTLSISTKRSHTTPVYNLQPALITANIGTMGRNIRHLPCVSLRTGTQGICMFAIDCLKANGTHLGTCIDRFYFGSCCHLPQRQTPPSIDSISGLWDNTIDENDSDIKFQPTDSNKDPSIIISSSTTEKHSTETNTIPILLPTQETFTFSPVKTNSSSTTSIKDHKPITLPLIQLTTTTTEKLITTQFIETTRKLEQTTPMMTTTEKPMSLITTQKVSSTVTRKSSISTTTTATRRRPTRPSTTTKKPPEKITSISENEIIKQKPTTDLPLKLTTFQTINNQTTTTIKYKPKPQKPSISINTPKPKPRPTTTTKPPSKYTSPSLTTLKIPSRTTTKRTPITKPTHVSKPIKIPRPTTSPITTKKTTKPTKTTTTFVPTTTTPKLTTFSYVSSSIITTTKKPVKIPTISTTTVKPTMLIPVQTIKPIIQQKNSSTTTPPSQHENEIVDEEQQLSSEHPPGLVTWTNIITDQVTTSTLTPTSTITSENASNIIGPTEWTPITTPDGWVLLPSVSPSSSSSTTTHKNLTTPQTLTTTTTSPTTLTSKSNITKLPVDNITSTAKPSSSSTLSSPIPISFPSTSSFKPPLVFPTDTATTTLYADNQTILNETKDAITTLSITTNFTSSRPLTSIVTDVTTLKPALNMTNYLEVCGRRMYPQARIVGGANSTFGKWPWQISLRQWRTSTYLHKCGAALLNENWAITAAHCVDSVPPSDLLLRLGEHDLSSDSEPYGYQERRVQIVASHPQFDPRTFEYDLALLRFYEPVTFQPNIIPVCVPNDDEGYVGKTAHVTGWGRLHEDGPLPNILQEVSVPVINNSVCEQMYRSAGYIEHIPNIFICAGWRRGGFDSCEGDSGGPMVIQRPKDKRFILAGIISWGIGCAEPNQPGVYTRISEFRHWINQILQF